MPPKEKDPEKPVEPPERPDREQRKQAANGRVRLAERAARTVLRGGPIRRTTRRGDVQITDVVVAATEDGVEYLDVQVEPGMSGQARFRIFNPPTGIRRGDTIEEDPVAALAEVLALHGAATGPKRRRTR